MDARDPGAADQREESLPKQVVRAARDVSLGNRETLDISPDIFIRIANEAALRRELKGLIRDQVQDPDTRDIILDHLAEFRIDEEHSLALGTTLADGLVRFVGGSALAVAGAGVAASIGAASIGSLALLAGAFVALTAVGAAWSYANVKADVRRKDIKKLERLEKDLREG